jgi:hypothetical protein
MTFSRPRAVGPAFAPPMAKAPGSFDPMAASIIERCTIGGNTRWQAVANMLGRCVHSVRSDYDPTYLKATTEEGA